MARHKATPGVRSGTSPLARWARLTWAELIAWAGDAAVTRGRDYQRTGHVRDLRVAEDGALLATVLGNHRYATTVEVKSTGKLIDLQSECTCPVGFACKHAVAVVADYLQAVNDERAVSPADPDDPRWARLEAVGDEFDDYEEGLDDGIRPPQPRRTKAWDDKVERHVRGLSKSELADLAWELVRKVPEAYQEIRDRISLQDGGADRLIADTRAEIDAVTAEPGWSRHWSNEGYTPDFRRVAVRFERLLELGQADAVVRLGRDYIRQAQEILELSDDEGETIADFGETLPVIFAALARSGLPGPERLLFVVDADLADQFDAIGSASEVALESVTDPADWSALAEALRKRLQPGSHRAKSELEFESSYRRERLTEWIARALVEADRVDDLEALYEDEARATGSYRRLVDYLVECERLDDAERWAIEGIAASAATLPGVAEGLAGSLAEIARRRKRWDVVAAHAARPFFERPGAATFDALMTAAKKAKVEPTVSAAAMRFLETGAAPWAWLDPPAAPGSPISKRGGNGRGKASAPPAPLPPRRLAVDPAWPLPVPPYFLHLMGRLGQAEPEPRPRFDVLLDMALAAGDPDEVLRRFDQLRAQPRRPGFFPGVEHVEDRVAGAIAKRHPARALELYRAKLDALLPRADQGAYAAATEYLKAMRPVYAALDRPAEWDELVASIRQKYKNRPRFMDLLATLDDGPIARLPRPKRP